jgi:rapamycin-insensitive companion of mTOR
LYRSTPSGTLSSGNHTTELSAIDEAPKSHQSLVFDDATFRQLLIDSNVLNSSNYAKWNWETINKIIDGPLQSGKRLEEAIKASKFMKRIVSFYRPFKYRFASVKNTRGTQKYVRAGCALMHSLLQSPEGIKFLADSKLLRQIAECLAQCDPVRLTALVFFFFTNSYLRLVGSQHNIQCSQKTKSPTRCAPATSRWLVF